ncbi:hypothetical protein HY972_03335 [Candidatus Kaiserbacteria bacterium]|nr:hypothetical protein [Candidatus Kaiserbacteria bacterium]
MPLSPEDDTGSLERARKRLYDPEAAPQTRTPLSAVPERLLPHAWQGELPRPAPRAARHVRLAGVFFFTAAAFFIVALSAAGYFFYFGGNAVSVDKIAIDIQGPTTVAGGETVPLSLIVTNKNPVAIENVTVEIDFPAGTRDASNVFAAYPHYVENLGTLASGANVTRSIKAVVFGGTGQTLSFPVSLSYGATGSNAVFVKKSSYTVAISAAPLEIAVNTLAETVSNKPLTLTLTVRSNAAVPLDNVVLSGDLPFGFSITSSSMPLNGSTFLLGTLSPGASKTVTLTGTLTGQNKEQRVFRFSVGTARASDTQTLAVTYMTQDATVAIVAPFIDATLALNGDTRADAVISPGSIQSVSVSYANTLATSVGNAIVAITLSGSAIDYDSIRTTNGFYNSATRTVVFSRDTDPALAALAPGASGVGTFTFSTLPVGALAPLPRVNFAISVSGTRVGQANVPEQVSSTVTRTAKVATAAVLSASALHSSGILRNGGPVPPRANQATTYSIVWNAENTGSTIAGGAVSTVLPSYVSYTGTTAGAGSFTYDDKSRTVTWNIGELAQRGSAQGVFQVSLVPSTSQRGTAPPLTGAVSFSGYDRFAGVQIAAVADPTTTETKGDPGYVPAYANVQ